MKINLDGLTVYHGVFGSVKWRLEPVGLRVAGSIDVSGDGAKLVGEIWSRDKQHILAAAERFSTPVELIIATAATESRGRHKALRKEPGYKSDISTPHRISPGVMQTLISTAQDMSNKYLGGVKVTRSWLYDPANSYMVGTAYIAHQRRKTVFDPPIVGAAYNSGGIYKQTGANNRWKLRQYPIGTGKHVDRFVKYFNDCFSMWGQQGGAPSMSFVHALGGPGSSVDPEQPKEMTMWSLISTIATTFLSGLFPSGKKGTPGTNIFRSILGLFGLNAAGESSGVINWEPLFGAGTGVADMGWPQLIMMLLALLLGNTGIESVIKTMPAAEKEPPADK